MVTAAEKTYLSMQMALYNVKEKGRNSKILGVREVSGEGKEIGFLPGDMEDKLGDSLNHSLSLLMAESSNYRV